MFTAAKQDAHPREATIKYLLCTSLRFRRQQQAPIEFAWNRTIQDQTLVTEETRLHECT
jgi:hypothetical protein